MVCEMVWGVTEHVITSWVMNRAGPAITDAAMEIESWGERGMAHCLDTRFVGSQLQGELREAWWSGSVFRFTSPEVVEWFFKDEFERLGVRGWVRKVRVELWYREYVARGRGVRLRGEVMGSKKGGCLEEDLRVLEVLRRETEVRLVIKKKDGGYGRDSVEVRREEFLKSVSRMFPALGRLQREGYRVIVEIGRGIEIKVGSEISEEEWRRQIDAAVEVRCVCARWDLTEVLIGSGEHAPLRHRLLAENAHPRTRTKCKRPLSRIISRFCTLFTAVFRVLCKVDRTNDYMSCKAQPTTTVVGTFSPFATPTPASAFRTYIPTVPYIHTYPTRATVVHPNPLATPTPLSAFRTHVHTYRTLHPYLPPTSYISHSDSNPPTLAG